MSQAEYDDLMTTGSFRPKIDGVGDNQVVASYEGKLFGMNLEETKKFAEFYPDLTNIVEVKIPTNKLDDVGEYLSMDEFIFENGVVHIPGDKLDEFNAAIKYIKDAY